MQRGEPQQGRAIGLGKVEPDCLRIADLQVRPRFEVHMRPGPERLFEPEILVPVESDNLRIKDFTVMKGHALAKRHLPGTVIEPPPSAGQARHQHAILAEFDEVLENVQHNGLPVHGGLIDNVQFSPWRWHLFPNTPGAPPTGDEHQDHASNNALFHGRPSLVALLGCCLAGLLWIHTVARQSPDACSRYYTAPEVA